MGGGRRALPGRGSRVAHLDLTHCGLCSPSGQPRSGAVLRLLQAAGASFALKALLLAGNHLRSTTRQHCDCELTFFHEGVACDVCGREAADAFTCATEAAHVCEACMAAPDPLCALARAAQRAAGHGRAGPLARGA